MGKTPAYFAEIMEEELQDGNGKSNSLDEGIDSRASNILLNYAIK